MNPVFFGRVEKGKLVLKLQDRFNDYLRSLEGQEVQVVVGKPRKPRSNQENRYYWGVVIKLLSEHTGYSEDEMHDALRMLFLTDKTSKMPTLKSTALLSTVEFEEYMSQIRMWASTELQVYVPEPNEVEA